MTTIDQALDDFDETGEWPEVLELIDEPLVVPAWMEKVIGPLIPQMSPALQTQIEFCRRAEARFRRIPDTFTDARQIYRFAQNREPQKRPRRSLIFFYRYIEQHRLAPCLADHWTLWHDELTVKHYEIIADVYENLDYQSGQCIITNKLPLELMSRLRLTRLKLLIGPLNLPYKEALRTKEEIYLEFKSESDWIDACRKAQKIFVMTVASADDILRIRDTPKVIWHTVLGFERFCELAKAARATFFFRVITRLPMELQMHIIAMLLPTTYNEDWGWPQRYFEIEDADLAWLRNW